MAHEVGTFLGEATEVLQIKVIVFSFLNPGDGLNCKAHQSNALLQYIYAWGIHTLPCVQLAVSSARQHNSASSKAIIIYYYTVFIQLTALGTY